MLLVIAMLLAPVALAQAPPSLQNTDEEQRRTAELHLLAVDLRNAIMKHDIDTLLKYVEVDPDHFISLDEARRVLEDPRSPAHCLLFDTRCRLDQLWETGGDGNPYQISAREFFQKHSALSIGVRFYGSGSRRFDLAQILYVIKGSPYDSSFPKWLNDPEHWKKWGEQYIDACLQRTADGWRYHAGAVGVFFCKDD